jgi:hypothetical protein
MIATDAIFATIDDYSQLERVLAEREDTFDLVEVETPRQLLLNSEGKTDDGYYLTWAALRQVAQLLSVGLFQVLIDLCGRRHAGMGDKSLYSDVDAIAVYNTFLNRRYKQRVEGRRMIRDISNRSIQAVVGRAYKRLSNLMFLQHVNNCLPQCPGRLVPHTISMVNRRLVLRFRCSKPLTSTGHPLVDDLYAGLSFANSEVGDASVRVSIGIAIGKNGWASGEMKRVAHAGAFFDRRLAAMFARTPEWFTDQQPVPSQFQEQFHRIARNLGFEGEGGPGSDDDERFGRLVDRLQVKPYSKSGARRVARRALFAGGGDNFDSDSIRQSRMLTWPKRTGLDLLAALVAESNLLPEGLPAREAAERLTYSFLTGHYDPIPAGR